MLYFFISHISSKLLHVVARKSYFSLLASSPVHFCAYLCVHNSKYHSSYHRTFITKPASTGNLLSIFRLRCNLFYFIQVVQNANLQFLSKLYYSKKMLVDAWQSSCLEMTLNFSSDAGFHFLQRIWLLCLTLCCRSTSHSNCTNSYVGIYGGYSSQVVNHFLNTSSSAVIENLLFELWYCQAWNFHIPLLLLVYWRILLEPT